MSVIIGKEQKTMNEGIKQLGAVLMTAACIFAALTAFVVIVCMATGLWEVV